MAIRIPRPPRPPRKPDAPEGRPAPPPGPVRPVPDGPDGPDGPRGRREAPPPFDPSIPSFPSPPNFPSPPGFPSPQPPSVPREMPPSLRAAGTRAPVSSSGACAFELDIQWILDAIDRLSNGFKTVGNHIERAMNIAADFLSALGGIVDLFCWIPGVGKFAKDVVAAACRLIATVQKHVHHGIAEVLQLSKHLLAPWEIRSAGKSISDTLAPKCEEFAQHLHQGYLKSAQSWTGAASEAFFTSYEGQYQAALDTATGAKEFGDAIHQLGQEGVTTTITFITELLLAGIGLVQAIITMCAVPVGTPIGAAEILGLVSAIIGFIMVWVNAMISMIQQMSAAENAAHGAVPGGEWPKAVVA